MDITVNGESLDLPAGFAAEIEESSPIFNDIGSQSLPITLPPTRRNMRLLGYPDRLDAADAPGGRDMGVRVTVGATQRTGVLNVTGASRDGGVELNIGFDNSIAYSRWKNQRLATLPTVADVDVVCCEDCGSVPELLDKMRVIGIFPHYELAVFPIVLAEEKPDGDYRTYRDMLNELSGDGLAMAQPGTADKVIDGKVTEVRLPAGYGVSPFVKVWRLLELVFGALDLTVSDNPFKTDPELARLVVLNNCADTCCTGRLVYHDLMPDCTVDELLGALWTRFGLVYHTDFDRGEARLSLIRDIIAARADTDISADMCGLPQLTYGSPRYLKLSATSSLEGAAPATERFEDFARDIDLSRLSIGRDVPGWEPTTDSEGRRVWDGDVREDWEHYEREDPEDPDYPDPDYGGDEGDEGDDGRDDEFIQGAERDDYAAPARARAAAAPGAPQSTAAREFGTCMWSRLDGENGRVKETSTSFFNWDPQPEGIEAMELSSADEWVPVRWTGGGYAPYYLTGSYHAHTYIRGTSAESTDGQQGPLAFMFAYCLRSGRTVGSFCPETAEGRPYALSDGSRPWLTLLFQFRRGLFDTFWRGYDELLRHAARTVEVPVMTDAVKLHHTDMLSPVGLRSLPWLIDKISYAAPDPRHIRARYTLRALVPQGHYDIDAEHRITDVRIAARRLVFFVLTDGYTDIADTLALRQQAAQQYKADTGYTPRDENGYYYDVTAAGVTLVIITRGTPYPGTDTTLPEPQGPGRRILMEYVALLTYDIREWRYASQDDATGEPAPSGVRGRITVQVPYSVEYVARWVYD